jgi:hypothetical protein
MKLLFVFFVLSTVTSYGQNILDLVGPFHNQGLSYARPLAQGHPISGQHALTIVNQYAATQENWGSTAIDLRYVNELERIMKYPSTSFRYAIEFCESLIGVKNLPTHFNEMRAVEPVITMLRRGTREEIVAALQRDLIDLKSKSVSSEAIALILLGIASAEYWVNDPGLTGGDVLPWIQVDCAGYLLGWAAAFYDDYSSGHDSGDRNRIRKGVERGLGASVGRFFR